MTRNFGFHPRVSPEARSLALDVSEGLAIFIGGLMVAGVVTVAAFCILIGG
jgi:hypothetical protein